MSKESKVSAAELLNMAKSVTDDSDDEVLVGERQYFVNEFDSPEPVIDADGDKMYTIMLTTLVDIVVTSKGKVMFEANDAPFGRKICRPTKLKTIQAEPLRETYRGIELRAAATPLQKGFSQSS